MPTPIRELTPEEVAELQKPHWAEMEDYDEKESGDEPDANLDHTADFYQNLL